ncbi:MAG: protein-L-isoaspartate(D-aspartate) O-methyltransferase [Fusobacteriota bacterium]
MNYKYERKMMVENQIRGRGVTDKKLLQVMKTVKRHEFIPKTKREKAYEDHPITIAGGQTISQPYIVAFMTEKLNIKSSDKILEIGTGSGYQTVILAKLAKKVYTVERIPELYNSSKNKFEELGINNIECILGNGFKGYKKEAPYDGIIVTAAPKSVPKELIKQLKEDGNLILPVGSGMVQDLKICKKGYDGVVKSKSLMKVRFVPMLDD